MQYEFMLLTFAYGSGAKMIEEHLCAAGRKGFLIKSTIMDNNGALIFTMQRTLTASEAE